MPTIDLDEARRAKQEVDAEPDVMIFGGREFKLSPGAPMGFLVGLGRVQKGEMTGLEEALEALLADPTEVRDLLTMGIGLQDLEPIVKGVYGLSLGEALASA